MQEYMKRVNQTQGAAGEKDCNVHHFWRQNAHQFAPFCSKNQNAGGKQRNKIHRTEKHQCERNDCADHKRKLSRRITSGHVAISSTPEESLWIDLLDITKDITVKATRIIFQNSSSKGGRVMWPCEKVNGSRGEIMRVKTEPTYSGWTELKLHTEGSYVLAYKQRISVSKLSVSRAKHSKISVQRAP